MERLKLGITNIGDLLLENSITKIKNENGDEVKLGNVNLSIPIYQRPYKWTSKNANQLFDDIVEAMNSKKDVYRVGTLILHKYKDKDKDVYNIVDGQQRIITFLLLFLCLDKETKQNFKLADNKFTINNVINNYRTFERRINNFSDKEKMAEYIVDKCEFVIVITENLAEAFQFFDSQNSRGKALYPHDLLKAYHLREMSSVDVGETERLVKMWEETDQKKLARLFNDYLYCLKEWIGGNRAGNLTEKNIDIFKGITSKEKYPFAQYHKGAFAYADDINNSHLPFVTGIGKMNPFQIHAPIIAGKPFFEYSKYYFDLLANIQNNDKYTGRYINDIIKTLDLPRWKNGRGNEITRLMFDAAILLYVDRFCPATPASVDEDFLNRFVELAFIWAYSMRAQRSRVGWDTAQIYIMGESSDIKNGCNIYKIISESDSPDRLLSRMDDMLEPIPKNYVKENQKKEIDCYDEKNKVYNNYLHFFKKLDFLKEK